MVLEEIGSPIHGTSPRGMRSSRLSEGIFGSRSGLRPRPLASSASSALSSPTRNGPSAQTTSLGEDALTSSLLMREELNETKDALDTALRRLHERETELETVRELQETEIERLRILHESEVETLKDEHAMALEKLRVRHESQLAAFGANADEMAKNLDAKDAELQAVLLERARLEDLVNELRQDLETSKAQIASIRIPSKALAAVASSMAPTSATPTTPLSAGHPTFAFASPASPAALFVSAPNTPLPPTPSPSTPLAFHVAAQTVSLPSTPETPAVRRAEIEALKKELEDAYEVISILEAREDWVDPEEVRAEEERLRKVIEDLDDKVMEQEIQAFKAQKELALESKRLEETKEFLEQALKENQEVSILLELVCNNLTHLPPIFSSTNALHRANGQFRLRLK